MPLAGVALVFPGSANDIAGNVNSDGFADIAVALGLWGAAPAVDESPSMSGDWRRVRDFRGFSSAIEHLGPASKHQALSWRIVLYFESPEPIEIEVIMAITFTKNHFSSQAEALAEIEKAGLWPNKREVPADSNQSHWHVFDAHVYVLEGSMQLKDSVTGETHMCGKGAKAVVPARTLHSEHHEGFTAIFGMSVDPSTVEQPVQRPPAELDE